MLPTTYASTEMTRLIHPLLVLITRATEKELVLYLEFVKAENRILRSKLPKHIEVTPAERPTLVKLGVPLGTAIPTTTVPAEYRHHPLSSRRHAVLLNFVLSLQCMAV